MEQCIVKYMINLLCTLKDFPAMVTEKFRIAVREILDVIEKSIENIFICFFREVWACYISTSLPFLQAVFNLEKIISENNRNMKNYQYIRQ
jgi:hypothetical protein